jgi:hypothetical protein
MFGLMDTKAFPKAYVDRLNSIPNAHSAFSLYIKVKDHSFPYINHSEYFMTQYEEIWNDLHFLVIDDASHKKVKHKLTYVYEVDGIQHEYSKYVNNNATIEDIYTEGIITEMPTKEVTAEKTYVFGTQENDVYIEFTGWRIRGDEKTLYERYETDGFVPKITTNTIVEPVFTGTDRKYYIRWYLKSTDTTPIKTAGPYNYGTGEAAEAPTVADI